MSKTPPLQGQIITIALLCAVLISMILMKDRCAHGVSSLFGAIDPATARLDGGAKLDAAARREAPLLVDPNHQPRGIAK